MASSAGKMISSDIVSSHIKNDMCQVFVMTSPATFPFSFAMHPWFVINRKGIISRFGVSWRDSSPNYQTYFKTHTHDACNGHLHKNALTPSQGLEVFISLPWHWRGKIIGMIEGGEGTLAARMAEFIENSTATYPYCGQYALRGPNSNTYVAWVLEKFPESGIKLPWRAFGKSLA